MPFIETINSLPFTPTTPNGRGLLAPLARATGHILYTLAEIERENATAEEIVAELQQAEEHWNGRVMSPALSTAATQHAETISRAIHEAVTELPDWDGDTRSTNIQSLAHRIVGFHAQLDRELVGYTNSDPGTTL